MPILPVAPASARGDLVLIEAQPHGTHPLDLRLVGCDGESPYVLYIKQSQLASLKHKFKGSDADWETVLAHFLLQKPAPHLAALLDGVRMVYALAKDSLNLFIQQDIQGIKVTWAELTLPLDESFELNPFTWAQASAAAHTETLQHLSQVTARIDAEKSTVAKLSAQLDDFIQTKNEAETAMLQQFMTLLNEKKRKIRDQSRLLATAKVDKKTAQAVQSARLETPRKPGPSRQSKRKAPITAKVEQDVTSDSEMDLDSKPKKANDGDDDEGENQEEDMTTPSHSDAETESDSSTFAASSTVPKSTSAARPVKETPSQKTASDGPPPPRALPFGRATRSKGPVAQPPPNDDDDETDDEEL